MRIWSGQEYQIQSQTELDLSHGLALPLISCTIFSEDLRGGSRAEEGKNGQHEMIDRDLKKKKNICQPMGVPRNAYRQNTLLWVGLYFS